MASWVRGTDGSVAAGVFDGEQIESPATPFPEELPPIQDVLDQVWLAYVRRGNDPRALAKELKVSKSTVYSAINRARLHEEGRKNSLCDPNPVTMDVLFGVNPHTPESPCFHPDHMKGENEYCPSCHRCSKEGRPSLKIGQGDYDGIPMITKMPADGKLGGTESKKRGLKPKSAAARKRQRAAS